MNTVLTPITLDVGTNLPPYEQVRATLAARISEGSLAAGTRLPTVRALAGELGLAAGTVARAYRELEEAGLVVTRGRAGTLVSDRGDRSLALARQAATQYAATTRALGLAPDAALALVRAQLNAQ